MQLQSLPRSFDCKSGSTMPVYKDHILFSEHLQESYTYPKQLSGMGILLTGKGVCDFYINGIKNQVNYNKLVFINRNSLLEIRIEDKGSCPILLFFNSRFPDLVQHSLLNGNDALTDGITDLLPYDFSFLERIYDNPRLHQTISSLVGLGSSCSSFASLKADMIIRGLFEDLLKENRQAFKLSQNLRVTKASTRLEIFKKISSAKEWMEENYQTTTDLEDISTIASMNSQHFLRMFKQIYQTTPHQYLMTLKCNKAKELLETTQMPVTEICQAIGFESIFSFSLLFKSRFGLAPSHFRKG